MLGIVASYHRIQFQVKRIIQSQENDEKPHFGPKLVPSNIFYKTSSQTLFQCNLKENWRTKLKEVAKNLMSGPILAHLTQIWVHKSFFEGFISSRCQILSQARNYKHELYIIPCRKLSLHAISRKTYDPNSIKWQKTSLFFKNLAYSCDPILKKLRDGRTDRQPDESEKIEIWDMIYEIYEIIIYEIQDTV